MTPTELLEILIGDGDDIIAVTGATGWFGRTTLEMLSAVLSDDFDTRVAAYASRSTRIRLDSGHEVGVRPLTELVSARPIASVLFHYAFLTKDRAADMSREQYVAANLAITASTLRAIQELRPRAIVMTSSGAAAGYGGSAPLDLETNPYGTLKRLDELAFLEMARELGVGCAVPRVYSVAGPWMTKPEKYALGEMIGLALGGGPIEIKADRPVFRSFCGVDEVVAIALWAAMRGDRLLFDTGNHELEVADLGRLIAHSVGDGCAVERSRFQATADADRYVGSDSQFRAMAADAGVDLALLEALIRGSATGSVTVRAPRTGDSHKSRIRP